MNEQLKTDIQTLGALAKNLLAQMEKDPPILTIGEQQAVFDQWYEEWRTWTTEPWNQQTPESLLDYFKARLCVTLGPLPEEGP